MGDIRIFKMEGSNAKELKGSSVELEKSLQTFMEKNLESLLGIKFLASEYATGKTHGGRVDSLGLDENGLPVIIEYKRAINEAVINQGLYYLDWLQDHRAEFELLVLKQLGKEYSDKIDWSGPRLLCIAGDFSKYDIHAVKQIPRNIELIRYRQYENQLLLLELVNSTFGQSKDLKGAVSITGEIIKLKKITEYKTISTELSESRVELQDRFESIKAFIEALGDDVQMNILKYYIAFKRIKNFACIQIFPTMNIILVIVKVNPDSIKLEEGFTRDVRKIGHLGTGDLEITVKSDDDLARAKELIVKSYEAN
jgi:predicted transport protein